MAISSSSPKTFYTNELTRYFTRGQLSYASLTMKTLQEALDDLNDVYESDDERDDDHSDEHHDNDDHHDTDDHHGDHTERPSDTSTEE